MEKHCEGHRYTPSHIFGIVTDEDEEKAIVSMPQEPENSWILFFAYIRFFLYASTGNLE
jgi:hypothetical protein